MRYHGIIHFVFALALSIAVVGGGALVSGTSFSTDQSDLWWNPTESGWGIQFGQTGSTLFATMYVSGPSGQPNRYTATLEAQPTPATWSGDLIATTGPWFGTVSFDPALVGKRTVGTMTWNALSVNSGTLLTYSVDGMAVSKTIYRQTLRYDDHNGLYPGGVQTSLCSDVIDQRLGFNSTVEVTQGPNQLVVKALLPSYTNQSSELVNCTFTGDYGQAGHFGTSQGAFTCSDGSHGTHVFTEMTVRKLGRTPEACN